MGSHEVHERIADAAAALADQAPEAEALGRLPEQTGKLLREVGIVRMLQPRRWGGYEAHPREFFEGVMAIAKHCGASGWVSGIVGVHPWELAHYSEETQEEVWGDDPDTWVASTYMPTGRARPVPGGYRFSGRWSFSSGCDVSQWIFLGGLVVDDDGQPCSPPASMHFLLPRSDFTIVDDSWQVVGLSGTGSKDIIVEDVFVPAHRTASAADIHNGAGPGIGPDTNPLYSMPWGTIFPNAITAPIIGMAEGALEAALAYQQPRTSLAAGKITESSIVMSSIGEAAGDIDACRAQLLRNLDDIFAMVCRGEELPMVLRARARRDQVQGSWRAVRAVDVLFDMAGGGALRIGTPLQRMWRDAHAGLHHVINTRDKAFHGFSNVAMGLDPLEAML